MLINPNNELRYKTYCLNIFKFPLFAFSMHSFNLVPSRGWFREIIIINRHVVGDVVFCQWTLPAQVAAAKLRTVRVRVAFQSRSGRGGVSFGTARGRYWSGGWLVTNQLKGVVAVVFLSTVHRNFVLRETQVQCCCVGTEFFCAFDGSSFMLR